VEKPARLIVADDQPMVEAYKASGLPAPDVRCRAIAVWLGRDATERLHLTSKRGWRGCTIPRAECPALNGNHEVVPAEAGYSPDEDVPSVHVYDTATTVRGTYPNVTPGAAVDMSTGSYRSQRAIRPRESQVIIEIAPDLNEPYV